MAQQKAGSGAKLLNISAFIFLGLLEFSRFEKFSKKKIDFSRNLEKFDKGLYTTGLTVPRVPRHPLRFSNRCQVPILKRPKSIIWRYHLS